MEGLATAFSITMGGRPFDVANLGEALRLTKDSLQYCENRRGELTRDLLQQANGPVTRELMAKYLYSGCQQGSGGAPGNVGYYVGTRIVTDLLERGSDIGTLTRTPGHELLQMWQR